MIDSTNLRNLIDTDPEAAKNAISYLCGALSAVENGHNISGATLTEIVADAAEYGASNRSA